MSVRRCFLAAVATLGMLAGPVLAQTPTEETSAARGVQSKEELETFLDGLLGGYMQTRHVAGAMVAVVKDGTLYFAKGYGYADFERRKPVDPERTMFRPGSVSKLFTWTAVMQLVEQGKLKLDTDVNTYLDFKIPATFPQPITLRHLMTHTAGFEESLRGLISEDSTSIHPLSEWLPSHLPERVRPPGLFSSYSNFGTAIAGYIVERVSGVPFAEYVERNILEPLGMVHSTSRQPLPAALVPEMSQGYSWTGGHYEAHPYEYLPGLSPAGMMSASATDMARFMIAHLQNGEYEGRRILADSTAQQMHARAFGHDPRLPGFALGFYEQSSHGLRIFGHGGDSQWFHTNLALVPSQNLGVYISFNTNTGGALTEPFLDAFFDHYYPAPLPPITAPRKSPQELAPFAGIYRSNRRVYTSYFKAFSLAEVSTVVVNDDSTLTLTDGDPVRLVPVGPLLFRSEVSNLLVAFKQDASGRITHAFNSGDPTAALEKQASVDAPSLHFAILGGSIVIFALIVLAALRRLVTRTPAPPETSARLGRRFLVGAALAYLVFAVSAMMIASNFLALLLGAPETKVILTLALPVLGALLTLGALIAVIVQWQRGAGTAGSRLRILGGVLVSVAFLWSLNHWNLFGWKL